MTPSKQGSKLRSKLDLKTVLETSRVLIEAQDEAFVFENLLRISMGKLLVSKAAILLHDADSNSYNISYSKGLPDLQEHPATLQLTNSLLSKSHILISEHEQELKELTPYFPSGAMFNLRTSDHHLGFLVLKEKMSQSPFIAEELEFVESLCIISSSAVANSRMFDQLSQANRQLDQRIHELNTLFDLSKEFNLLADRDKISRIFKFALMGQLFIRSFFLVYRSDNRAELLASSNLSANIPTDTLNRLLKETEEITNVDEELAEEFPVLKESDICSLITISVHGRKVALIGVGNRANSEPFTESDYNFLKSLSNLAINSIQRTYLIEERIEKERMEEELSLAKSIQNKLLPDVIPDIPGADLSAVTVSCYQVGGDYYDIVETPDGNHILAIADVTGKGFAASLLMANLQSMLHILLPFDITLPVATERINDLLYQNTPIDKFITFFWGKYHHQTNRFHYVNAGHNPPLLLRNNSSEFCELSEGGLLLGAMESTIPYESADLQLSSGDIIVFYTDGVNEARSQKTDEEFGEERLQEIIHANRDKTSQKIQDAIIRNVKEFTGASQYDDLTLIVFKAD
ncbi:MAG: SpoIIE family protein phosphatase [Bacteroidetes bacterium]|nr:SpoIIE family protein phosphatase [Bacteroidota bacterium]